MYDLYYRASILIAVSFIISLVSLPMVRRLALRIGAVDKPDPRKVHQQTMPRLGGTSFVLGFMLTGAYLAYSDILGSLAGILAGGGIIYIVGALDDVLQLKAVVKLLGQIIAAGVAVYFGVRVDFITNPFDGLLYLGHFSVPLTILWLVGVTNAINLIDGLDGLAGGVSAIAAITMGLVALRVGQFQVATFAFILAAGICGFLPYNFNPARIFMGDAGSLFLGFVLACLSVVGLMKSAAIISLFTPVAILGIPIFDTLFAIVRRARSGAPIFMPDKAHLHHRLMALGMSHRQTVLAIYGVSIFFGTAAVALTYLTSPQAMVIMAVLMVVAVIAAVKIGIITGGSREVAAQVQAASTEE